MALEIGGSYADLMSQYLRLRDLLLPGSDQETSDWLLSNLAALAGRLAHYHRHTPEVQDYWTQAQQYWSKDQCPNPILRNAP